MRHCYQFSPLFLILLFNACAQYQQISCAYVPKVTDTHKTPEITQVENCARIDKNNEISISRDNLNQISFNKTGLAEIRINTGVYYVNKTGQLVRSHLFDNGADYFKEGLSRTIQDRKFGFINQKLEIVIQPKYDFAFPFSNGASKVCLGCTPIKVGEHTEMRGGKWGYIDKSGNIIVEIVYDIDQLMNLNIK